MNLPEQLLANLKIKPATEEQKKKTAKGCLGCFGVVFVGFVLLAIIGTLMDSPEDHIPGVAIYYLKQHANDPDSVKIESVSVVKQDQPGRNGYVAYIKYRAKNGFGALTLGEAYLEIDSSGKNVVQMINP